MEPGVRQSGDAQVGLFIEMGQASHHCPRIMITGTKIQVAAAPVA
jgi:hypothetical protein